MKPKQLGIIMDPIISINPQKDTTLGLMIEAQSRGWEMYYMEMADVLLVDDEPMAYITKIEVIDKKDDWCRPGEKKYIPLKDLDVVLMRKDPPFNIEYIMCTYILEILEEKGTHVINRPASLRDVNEKLYTHRFPDSCPPCLATRSKESIRQFLDKHQKIVIKPTHKMGGQSIYVVESGNPNTNIIIEDMTANGSQYVHVQKYLPEIRTSGDKRIILINGEPIKFGIARIPCPDDHRGNMAVGAVPIGFELTERDLWLCHKIGPDLRRRGLFFVGLDIIGDYITEINITSPTGIREIDQIFEINIAASFFDSLESII